MTDLPETLKALTDTAAGMLAKAIGDVRLEAKRFEEMRQLEHRAFMAESREALAILTRQVEERLSTVKDGADGRDGTDGRDGIDGRDGRDADMEALQKQVSDLVSAIPVPKDGRDGIDGRDGVDGKDGRDGTDGANGADGKDADMEVLVAHLDALVAAIPVPQDGKDGRDGIDGRDAYAGEAKGLFDPEAEYRAMDVVSFNGSEWRAKRDNPGELPGDGWMLSACKGKRGDRGERGPDGKEGRKGEDGASVIASFVDLDKLELVLTRDDGQEVKADLHPLATMIKEA